MELANLVELVLLPEEDPEEELVLLLLSQSISVFQLSNSSTALRSIKFFTITGVNYPIVYFSSYSNLWNVSAHKQSALNVGPTVVLTSYPSPVD